MNFKKNLKNFFVGAAVCGLACLPFVALANTAENLITNPSVETSNGANPLGWSRGSWGTNNNMFTYPVSGFDGAKAIQVTMTSYVSGDAKWFADDITVTPGKTYTFSNAYQSTATTSLVIRYTSTSNVASYVVLAATVAPSTPWKQMNYNFTVPPGVRSVSVWHVLSSVGTLTTDLYSIVDGSAGETNPNLITNPSFENIDSAGDPVAWQRGGWGTNSTTFIYPTPGFDTQNAAQVRMNSYVDGAAEWYFDPIPVTAGQSYSFSDNYRSDVATVVTAQFTLADGTFEYVDIASIPSATSWTKFRAQITPPPNATQVALFHILNSVGTLTVDDFALSPLAEEPDPDLFTEGMVSLTFDDGWLSHYTNALPILNAANMKGSFEIISLETLDALPYNRISNPSLESADSAGNPVDWLLGGWGTNNAVFTYPVAGQDGAKAAKITIGNYIDGDAKWFFKDATVVDGADYSISDYYKSDATTTVTARYNMGNNVFTYANVATLAPRAAWTKFVAQVTIPANVESFTFFHHLDSIGSLTVDNADFSKVQIYVSASQVLQMQNNGHEIDSHTRTHPSLTSISSLQMHNEITGSRSDLLAMGVTPVNILVYPYGDYDPGIESTTAGAGYIAARAVDRGYNVKSTDKFALKIQQVDVNTSVDQVKMWIDTAVRNKTWLILMFHQIDLSGDELSTTPASLQAMINYLSAARVAVVTMQQGVAQMN